MPPITHDGPRTRRSPWQIREHSTVLLPILAGIALALTVWGGHLDVIPAGLLPLPNAALGDSAIPQEAHTLSVGVGATLPACIPHLRTNTATHKSFAGACVSVHAASRSSAGASAP
jgi:hypothetical protein